MTRSVTGRRRPCAGTPPATSTTTSRRANATRSAPPSSSKIKPAASFILNEQTLADTVRTYADFLPMPIHIDDDADAVNLMAPPWEDDEPDAGHPRLHRPRSSTARSRCACFRSHDARVSIGHDSITVPLQGFLFVPPGSVASVREYGDLNVFIRRMFICERERDLLPPWARFVRGVIECPLLQPTASREGIHQDENFELVRQALEEQLGRGLQQLARDDPATWQQVVRGHSDVIIGWAVSDNEFFEKVEDIVTFRTTRGPLSLPEYLEQSGGSLYYVTRELGSLQEQVLAEGRDVPAIDASWFSVTPFLEKYAQRHPDVNLVQLDGESQQLLRPAPEGAVRARCWSTTASRACRRAVAAFKPAEAPALVLYPQGAELAREAEASLQAGDLPGPLAGLVQRVHREAIRRPRGAGRHALPQRLQSARPPPGREAARRRDAGRRADADPPDGPPVRRPHAVGRRRGQRLRQVTRSLEGLVRP